MASKLQEKLNANPEKLQEYNTLKQAFTNNTFIKRADLTELKALSSPPRLVQQTLSALLLLTNLASPEAPDGKPEVEWRIVKKLLCDANFLRTISNGIDEKIENLDKETVELVGQYVNDEKCSLEHVRKVSAAASNVCEYVRVGYEFGEFCFREVNEL